MAGGEASFAGAPNLEARGGEPSTVTDVQSLASARRTRRREDLRCRSPRSVLVSGACDLRRGRRARRSHGNRALRTRHCDWILPRMAPDLSSGNSLPVRHVRHHSGRGSSSNAGPRHGHAFQLDLPIAGERAHLRLPHPRIHAVPALVGRLCCDLICRLDRASPRSYPPPIGRPQWGKCRQWRPSAWSVC